MKRSFFLSIFMVFAFVDMAQTFTMSKRCRASRDNANVQLEDKKYQAAIDIFNTMENECNTKDAREAVFVGKAEAFNGLGKYNEAIAYCDAALKITKNKSLSGLFQKAIAQNKSGQIEASKSTLANVIALTEKNRDSKARASNYALLSMLNYGQLSEMDSAYYYIDKAMELDHDNINFVIQKADMLAGEKKYDLAFILFDKAVELGRTDMEMYLIRSNTRIKMVQEKYNTINTQELKSKMNPIEREQVCRELMKVIKLGLRDMKQDLFAALVCN